jgi:CRISPR-associated protein Csm5
MNSNIINIEVETLTPVHIGSGNNLKGNYEYLYFEEEGVIGVIEPKKVLNQIGKDNINQWIAIIDNEKNLLDDLPMLKNSKSEDLSKRVINVYQKVPNYKNDIKEQLHLSSEEPTIPGSSLKGAIRTAILTKLIQDEPSYVQEKKHLGSQKGSFFKFNDAQITANYLGKQDGTNRSGEIQGSPNKDLLRFLRVGDIHFEKNTVVVKNTIINLFRHGWGEKERESSYYECIPKGAIAQSRIQTPTKTIERVREKKYVNKNFDLIENPTRLFKLINKHTLKLLEKEIMFWEDEENPLAIGSYLEELERIEKIVKGIDEKSCIIRVGANLGWEYMTGGWANGTDNIGDFVLLDEHWTELKKQLRKKQYDDNTTFPKTRKMIDGGMPMGFVKLNF